MTKPTVNANEAKATEQTRAATRRARARLIVVPKTAAGEANADAPASASFPDDPFHGLGEDQVIDPPLDLLALTVLPEQNHELGQVIDAMAQNIDGFGHTLVPRVQVPDEIAEADTENIGEIDMLRRSVRSEQVRLTNFFNWACPDLGFIELRRRTRQDLERTGNAYWEVIPQGNGEIAGFEHLRSYQMRLTPQEQETVEVDFPTLELQIDGSWKRSSIKRRKRFRKFVQARYISSSFGGSAVSTPGIVWFKEFGDPRQISRKTGKVLTPDELAKAGPDDLAHEVIHWSIYSARSPYGLPRFIGSILPLYGMRAADDVNYTTLTNNNIPSMMLLVSNGQLTQGTIDRLTTFTEELIASDNNYSKFLVIEAEPVDEEGEDGGQMKIEAKPLNQAQIRDAMFGKYIEAAEKLVRRNFRLPPLFVGAPDDYTRSTADTSRRVADEQVFAPERGNFDDFINRRLFPRMGVTYHKFKSNSPNTTDNAELVKILAGSEKTGGMTPRIARIVLQDILGQELPDFPKDFEKLADVPFSLSMAEAVKNKADPAEPGQQATALKSLEIVKMLTGADDDDAAMLDAVLVERLERIQKRLDTQWREMRNGEHVHDDDDV